MVICGDLLCSNTAVTVAALLWRWDVVNTLQRGA